MDYEEVLAFYAFSKCFFMNTYSYKFSILRLVVLVGFECIEVEQR